MYYVRSLAISMPLPLFLNPKTKGEEWETKGEEWEISEYPSIRKHALYVPYTGQQYTVFLENNLKSV